MSLREAEDEIVEEFPPDDPLVQMMSLALASGEMQVYHAMESMMRQNSATRKAQNARMIEQEKTWKRMKAAAEPALLTMLAKHGEGSAKDPKARRVKTMLGTSYLRYNAAKAVLREDQLYDDDGTINSKIYKLFQYEDFFEGDPNYETVDRLTHEGKEKLKLWALDHAEKTGEELPWAQVTPPGPSVSTRLNQAKLSNSDERAVGSIKRILALEASGELVKYHQPPGGLTPDELQELGIPGKVIKGAE